LGSYLFWVLRFERDSVFGICEITQNETYSGYTTTRQPAAVVFTPNGFDFQYRETTYTYAATEQKTEYLCFKHYAIGLSDLSKYNQIRSDAWIQSSYPLLSLLLVIAFICCIAYIHDKWIDDKKRGKYGEDEEEEEEDEEEEEAYGNIPE
jgi:hypothetical protein